MKKFLTVLLALSVVFTYTVGSAFAVAPEDVETVNSYFNKLENSYLDGDFEDAADNFVNKTLSYDEDGILISDTISGAKGIVSKAVIAEAVKDFIPEAKEAFRAAVKTLREAAIAASDWTTTEQNAAVIAVKGAFGDAVADSAIIAALDVQDLLDEQLKVEVAAAEGTLAKIVPGNYSNDVDQWKLTAKPTTEVANGWTYADVAGVTQDTEFTAKAYVEAIKDTQAKVIAENKVKTADATVIADVKEAAKIAEEVVFGHKITDDENYYIAAIPTIEDLNNDTTVEEAKDTAEAQIDAAAAAKEIELQAALQAEIDELNKQAKPDAVKLATLKEQKAELASYFDAVVEVAKAHVNYESTVAAVQKQAGDYVGLINSFAMDTTAVNGLSAATISAFANLATRTLDVAKIKAEGARRAELKDVNGKPYYDADVLKKNVEKAVKAIYTEAKTYGQVVEYLDEGFEVTLIQVKQKYIAFISEGVSGLDPIDSKGQKVKSAWNLSDADANVVGTVDALDYTVNVDTMYDEAQAAALDTLVEETVAAIEAATTVAEIEKIFAEANDKYEAIPTTQDHFDSWAASAAVGSAYNAGKYEADLYAAASAFIAKLDKLGTLTTDYPTDVQTVDGIMEKVVAPIMYEAYAADELTAKVAEAKAAIEKIQTVEQVKEQKKAVETLIDGISEVVTLADKVAIEAAKAALEAYKDTIGSGASGAGDVVNEDVLEAKIAAYEALAAKQLDDAYKALAKKNIAVADKAAVEELRALYDTYAAFCEDNEATPTADTDDADVKAIEVKLLDALVYEVKDMMTKLPANPTSKDKAQVEAARAAYEALPLEGKAQIVGTLEYDNLIDAEEALAAAKKDSLIAGVRGTSLKASSSAVKGAITVKWTKSKGYKVDFYEVYKSKKANSGFGKLGDPYFKTTKTQYKNTKELKKGTRYYYKVRGVREIDGKNYYTQWSNKAYRIAK